MDAGIASLLGALAGAASGTGAALITYRGLMRQSDQQSQRERVDKQRETYAALITAAHQFETAAIKVLLQLRGLPSMPVPEPEFVIAYREAYWAIAHCIEDVVLAGPSWLVPHAEAVREGREEIHSLTFTQDQRLRFPVDEHMNSLTLLSKVAVMSAKTRGFAEAANKHIEACQG
ncbi:hypothetical protein [Streptomyces sp. BA2]|uniref:hypothetical protein n=1 Tax=Streptomyces sp. BA2 TaxID=436595 RepID=UPI0013234ABF|nr:hypothetical protein [Streptomyces sp. BA2]MWA16209.1 hypothetical protein [Streptomyces sp. BA2]